jgi:HK97 family phage prohead protease
MPNKSNGEIEYRFDRAAPKLEGGKLSGRAAPFNSETMIGQKPWGFKEKIARGAFKKSINDGDVVLLDQHDTAKPISRQSADTLSLVETKGGLDWDAIPADTSYARDAIANADAGNYGGCSFGFQVVRDSWHYNEDDDVDERTLHEVKLHEISLVTFPAYSETNVSARDQVDAAMEARDRFYFKEYGLHLEEERADSKPYGNVAYADPKNGKYPIDTKAHVKAAWSYINMPKNADKYPLNGVTLSSVKAKIKAAAKKFGITIDANESQVETDMPEAKREETKVSSDLLSAFRSILWDDTLDHEAKVNRAQQAFVDDLLVRANESLPAYDAVSEGNGGMGVDDTDQEGDGDGDDDDDVEAVGPTDGQGVGDKKGKKTPDTDDEDKDFEEKSDEASEETREESQPEPSTDEAATDEDWALRARARRVKMSRDS